MSDMIAKYNYDEFVDEKFERWMRFDESPRLGSPAPDHTLTTLDGHAVKLSDIRRKNVFTVIEFGSLT